MSHSRDRSYPWVFYTTAGFLFAGALLRALLVVEDVGVLLVVVLLLLVWLALFASEIFISRLWRPWFIIYLVIQTVLVVLLFSQPGSDDFYAVLFGILSMQVFRRFGLRLAVLWLVLFIPLTLLSVLGDYDAPEAITVTLVYTAVNVILGAYVLLTRRATEARAQNEALGNELQAANASLTEYSRQLERLAVARERNRFALELHDSVTQTIFSMTLASQSAAILLAREPARVDALLDRLSQLTQNALAEIHLLVSELAPDAADRGDIVATLRREVERRHTDGIAVSFEVEEPADGTPGAGSLSRAEQQGLFRIAQEALNNVVKHSGASEATVRLRLRPPASMQVEDRGKGFDVRRAADGAGMGMASMAERAAEMGWRLDVTSSAGGGTLVVVERQPSEGGDT
jgi:signal transduction histidine kinase